MIDESRKFDLEELARAKSQARTTRERERFEKLMYQLINQSTKITSLRQELIAATRYNDVAKIKRMQQQIQAVRLDETRGASWGQNKKEREIR